MSQLQLIEMPRQPKEWDEREVYYSLPAYIWPLVEYLRRLAWERHEYTHIARHWRVMARKWARQVFAPDSVFVEPCAGGGALIDGWMRYAEHACGERIEPNRVVTGDIRDGPTDWVGDWSGDQTPNGYRYNRPGVRDIMGWGKIGATRPFSLVATNPPFSRTQAIVETSWQHCLGITAWMQRSGWYEPTEERGRWLQRHNPDQIVIGRCMFYRPDGSCVGYGGSESYSWYVTGPNRRGLLGGHHEIIKWRDAPALKGDS